MSRINTDKESIPAMPTSSGPSSNFQSVLSVKSVVDAFEAFTQ